MRLTIRIFSKTTGLILQLVQKFQVCDIQRCSIATFLGPSLAQQGPIWTCVRGVVAGAKYVNRICWWYCQAFRPVGPSDGLNRQKWSKLTKIAQNGKNDKHWLESPKTAKKDQNWLKSPKMVKNQQNHQKEPKFTKLGKNGQNDQNVLQSPKMV